MRTVYLDCGMGAAGDMLTAALYELMDEKDREEFLASIRGAGIPKTAVSLESMTKCGIVGTHFTVRVDGEEEASEDVH
ncbi:MAG TPA: TIGR00299 family protein, partial [Lachnospiraceae bacterium]|nr:TIGR00299 family protein [Lachnospiraceae bacterium]